MDLVGRPEPQALAGPAVDGIVHPLNLLVRDPGEVGLLREILAQQAVGVLVGAALPRVARQREVEDRPRPSLDPPELGELLPLSDVWLWGTS